MTEKKNLFQRLHAVMKDVSYIQKEDKKVNNQYTFVSHDAVTAKIRPALVEHGVIAIPQNLKYSRDGNMTEVTLDIAFINVDNPQESFLVPSLGYGIDPQDKGPGKAISYAVKYALLKALSLETGDDPERDMIDHKPDQKLTRDQKIFQRDFLYDLHRTEDIESLIEERAKHFDEMPESVNEALSEAIATRRKQIKDGVRPFVKFAFIDVQEAVDFEAYALNLVEKAKDTAKLGQWMVDNDERLKLLDTALSAKKYEKPGGPPYMRITNAYNKRLPAAAE